MTQLPATWDVIAVKNIFLSAPYLEVLEKSAPSNMDCHFIGLFDGPELVGIALSQFIDLNNLQSFGNRDRCLKTIMRNFVFKNFASQVLFIGNNMFTGQNAFAFADKSDPEALMFALKMAGAELKIGYKAKGKKVHLTTFKDFFPENRKLFSIPELQHYYEFSTQPNMIFKTQAGWKTEQHYVDALSKKYRDQYKRARKKIVGIEKRILLLEDIIAHETTIYELYFHVAKHAPFNTFFLAKNHFRTFKELLKDDFLFFGYFLDDKLVGFNTLIKNGNVLDTYFLGYDDSLQREKMLYLNMLYDKIAYAIENGYAEIILARTALEIKSSVGAVPVKMYGYINHSISFFNKHMPRIFSYLEPETEWKERNPFK